MSWLEINTYVHSYVSMLGYFEDRAQALRYIVEQCREDPTRTIGGILREHFSIEVYHEELERSLTELGLENEIEQLETQLAIALSRLLQAEARIEELESE